MLLPPPPGGGGGRRLVSRRRHRPGGGELEGLCKSEGGCKLSGSWAQCGVCAHELVVGAVPLALVIGQASGRGSYLDGRLRGRREVRARPRRRVRGRSFVGS